MAIESIHADEGSNRRQRQLMKGSLEDRVEALEAIVSKATDKTKLTKKEKDKLKKIDDAEKAHPSIND